MICPNCKNQVIDDAEFCSNCGIYLNQQKNIQYSTNSNPIPKKQHKKKKNLFFAIIIVLAIIIGIIVFFKFVKKNNLSGDKVKVEDSSTNDDFPSDNNLSDNSSIEQTEIEWDKDGSFLMPIENVFSIPNRGLVFTGQINRGTVKVGDTIQIIGLNHETIATTVLGIEKFRDLVDNAEAGDNVGISIGDFERDQFERGQVLVTPDSIRIATKFDANVDVLDDERSFSFSNESNIQFYFRTVDIEGKMILPNGLNKLSSGDSNISLTIELERDVAMEVGTKFNIRTGGRTLANGVVTKVY